MKTQNNPDVYKDLIEAAKQAEKDLTELITMPDENGYVLDQESAYRIRLYWLRDAIAKAESRDQEGTKMKKQNKHRPGPSRG
jgi:hypothetical protein